MRAFFRPVATLALGPILFVVVLAYLRAATTGADGLLSSVPTELLRIYTDFTLPALALMLAVLLPVDLVLRRSGLGLLTIAASPAVAVLVALLLGRLVSEPHVQHWAAAIWLFFAYGLTWGLTIRDPRTVMAA